MNSTLFWINIILLVVIIALIIWLLARGSQTECKERAKLNQSCTQNSDCNTGLVCDQLLGGKVCKVPSGGVCETSTDCSTNLTCQNGVCMAKGGGLNDPCPCGEGLTCVNNVCKRKTGGPCAVNSDCADEICKDNVCAISDPAAFADTNNCGECGMYSCECYRKYDTYDYSDDEHKYYYSSSDSRSYHKKRRNHKRKHHQKSYSDESYSSESSDYYKKKHPDSRSRYYSVSYSKPCYTDSYKTTSSNISSSSENCNISIGSSSKPSSYTMSSSISSN